MYPKHWGKSLKVIKTEGICCKFRIFFLYDTDHEYLAYNLNQNVIIISVVLFFISQNPYIVSDVE